MDTLFPADVRSKRERVLAALRHQPVDRVPLLEQLSYNPRVIADWTGRPVEGFYCLEPGCGMDVVALKNTWPHLVWAGGVDGVDLLERGTPEQVRAEVHRHIAATRALDTGGLIVASSSEINPPIPPANFRAMVEAVGESTLIMAAMLE
ncbi:MAG: uroporphyrinogen decarboxylase family protein [Candidatus Latescibacterota bacterium]